MRNVVILFKGSQCVPCTQFEPIFDEVMDICDVSGVYKFVDDFALMGEMGVRTVPAVVLAVEVEPGVFVADYKFAGPQLRKALLMEAVDSYF